MDFIIDIEYIGLIWNLWDNGFFFFSYVCVKNDRIEIEGKEKLFLIFV